MPLHVSSTCGHREAVKIVLYSLWYHYRPKQVEMIEIINKPLLLHLVGYLYYWQMGFKSVFKGLRFLLNAAHRRCVQR